ncbi:hypothetical protein [Microbulbifer sp. SAOS-129_SWC]|uniref:hypothetical protein n=1 Tax=Microbulbifer sp. SAOS-129_SWC TaxID=3145235 RepID=UPI00321733CE
MAFIDIPDVNPYCRFFSNGPTKQLIFSSHGIWSPKSDGMTRVNYTYHWYSQPTEPLYHSEYLNKLPSMGHAEPIDTLGPGSGSVANTLFVPLDQQLFMLTARAFQNQVRTTNPLGLSLLAFHGSNTVRAMNLHLLDKQLLPALKYPVNRPVHMIVCRSLQMKAVTPVVRKNVTVIGPALTPFNSITNDML